MIRIPKKIFCCLMTISLLMPGLASAQEPVRFQIQGGYEEWELPLDETMGMARMGLHRDFGRYFNAGVDFYSAVKGEYGGFITFGLSGGLEYPLTSSLYIEGGLFVGAGGGRSANELVGGGLMVRENLGLGYQLGDKTRVSLGYSHVDFSDEGTIESDQIYLGFSRSLTALIAPAGDRNTGSSSFDPGVFDHTFSTHEFSVAARHLRVGSNVLTGEGLPQDDLGLLGTEWRTFLGSNWFLIFDAAGAMKGSSQGYMHLLTGAGYRAVLGNSLSAYGSFALGGGGGGDVDTGGGLLWDAGLGIQYSLSRDWFLDLSVSRLWAQSSEFESLGAGVQLGRRFGPSSSSPGNERDYQSNAVRIRLGSQTYSGNTDAWRNRPEEDVHNFAVQLDYFMQPNWYLTGQGVAAHSGEAGAYMAGLLGSGLRFGVGERVYLEGEGLFGAAGGGGLSNGSGLVYQANLAIGWRLTDSLELSGSIGQIRAANGDLDASVYALSLGYRFKVLSGR